MSNPRAGELSTEERLIRLILGEVSNGKSSPLAAGAIAKLSRICSTYDKPNGQWDRLIAELPNEQLYALTHYCLVHFQEATSHPLLSNVLCSELYKTWYKRNKDRIKEGDDSNAFVEFQNLNQLILKKRQMTLEAREKATSFSLLEPRPVTLKSPTDQQDWKASDWKKDDKPDPLTQAYQEITKTLPTKQEKKAEVETETTDEVALHTVEDPSDFFTILRRTLEKAPESSPVLQTTPPPNALVESYEKLKFLYNLRTQVSSPDWNTKGHGIFSANRTPQGIIDLRKELAQLDNVIDDPKKTEALFLKVQNTLKKKSHQVRQEAKETREKSLFRPRRKKREDDVADLYKQQYELSFEPFHGFKANFLRDLYNEVSVLTGKQPMEVKTLQKLVITNFVNDSRYKTDPYTSQESEHPFENKEAVSLMFDKVQEVIKKRQKPMFGDPPQPVTQLYQRLREKLVELPKNPNMKLKASEEAKNDSL